MTVIGVVGVVPVLRILPTFWQRRCIFKHRSYCGLDEWRVDASEVLDGNFAQHKNVRTRPKQDTDVPHVARASDSHERYDRRLCIYS